MAEVGIGEETAVMVPAVSLPVKGAADEDILLVEGVTLAEGLHHRGHKAGEVIVAVLVCRVFLHGVLHPQHGGVLTVLGVDDTGTIDFLDAEVDVLEDAGPLAACAESPDGNGHAHKHAEEDEYDGDGEHIR